MKEQSASIQPTDLTSAATFFAMNFAGVPLAPIADEAGDLVKRLASLDPLKAAATFGALLLQKRLQANCLRLEVLVHLCVAHSQGVLSPTSKLLSHAYESIGEACGVMEDPSEDVFVGNICSAQGNYRVLEGIWESGTFYLQRIVNMVDGISNQGAMRRLALSVHALLRLSDLACERAALHRNDMGNSEGEEVLPSELSAECSSLRSLVQFDFDDLHQARIEISDLAPFIFDLTDRAALSAQSITHTSLERRPLLRQGDLVIFALPSAVSAAVRRFVIEILGGADKDIFLHNLGVEYFSTFDPISILGGRIKAPRFQHIPGGIAYAASMEVDKGRYLNTIFFIDTLDGFESNGLVGFFTGNDRFKTSILDAIETMQKSAASEPGFRDGLTLLVGCGVGRGISLPLRVPREPNWSFEFLGAPDLMTLSESSEISPLHLWRINDMQERLAGMGGHLQNVNGLLNLYAWAESLKGHLVPHDGIPQEALNVQSLHLIVNQNSLLQLRHEVALDWDRHVQRFVDGRWLILRTKGRSLFEEDRIDPIYGHVDTTGEPRLLGACIGRVRCWWFEVTSAGSDQRDVTFERWEMLGTWMRRAIHPLEAAFGRRLRAGPVFWHCHFKDAFDSGGMDEPGTAEDAEAAIVVHVEPAQQTVVMTLSCRFDRAIFNVENVAERALVAALVSGIAKLAKTTDVDQPAIVQAIVPNSAARQSHVFPLQAFRDHFHQLRRKEPVQITSLDDAAAKLGLGWKVRAREDGGVIEGKTECLSYLGDLVRKLEDDLCAVLRTYNKAALIRTILLNHETASVSRDRWHRSASAMLALRDDHAATLRGMGEHEFKLNAVFQPSRNLIEIALCESRGEGGITPGELDLSRLLTSVAEIYQLGGWSDLIFWDAMKPSLLVRPYGDVHGHLEFTDSVLDAFGRAASSYRYKDSASNYSRHVERRKAVPESNGVVDSDFLNTWTEEFGVTLDAYRRFVDAVENVAVDRNEPVIGIRSSELIALADTPEVGALILESMTLHPRVSWRDLPDGYSPKEIMPWRFRRRLSVLRRPLLRLDNTEDPTFMVAPGLVREGFSSTVANYYFGSYPNPHLRAPMLRYAGRARARDGLAFNRKAAEEMSRLGWRTESEVKLTKIIGKPLDRDYGDVDVLAWDPATRRVLVMECKDLQFRKTHGEIAEQVADFRGEVSPDGKRDLLRKHMDRLTVLRVHRAEVGKYLKLGEPFTIEGHLVFSHPVPMLFATSGPISEQDGLHVFNELWQLEASLTT